MGLPALQLATVGYPGVECTDPVAAECVVAAAHPLFIPRPNRVWFGNNRTRRSFSRFQFHPVLAEYFGARSICSFRLVR